MSSQRQAKEWLFTEKAAVKYSVLKNSLRVDTIKTLNEKIMNTIERTKRNKRLNWKDFSKEFKKELEGGKKNNG